MSEILFIAFRVNGVAQPSGSKTAYVVNDRDGNPVRRGATLTVEQELQISELKMNREFMSEDEYEERLQEIKGKPGSIIVNVVDSCKASGPWKKYVARIGREAMRKMGAIPIDIQTEGRVGLRPLRFVARFVQKRPKKHFRTGKFSNILRDDAPAYPTDAPDVLKLARSMEDALMGVVYRDDSAIVRESVSKQFGAEDYVDVEVWLITG